MGVAGPLESVRACSDPERQEEWGPETRPTSTNHACPSFAVYVTTYAAFILLLMTLKLFKFFRAERRVRGCGGCGAEAGRGGGGIVWRCARVPAVEWGSR